MTDLEAPIAPRRSFGTAAATTFGANVTAAFLSLANVLVTARVLGPTGRGEFVFLTTVAMLTSVLSSLGIEEATANLAGREPARRRSLGGNVVLLAVAFGTAAAFLVASLMSLFPSVAADSDPVKRGIVLAAIPLLILQFYLQFLVRADYGFVATNVAALLGPLLSLVVNCAFAVLGVLTVGTAIATWVAGQAIATALLVWYVHARLAGFGTPDLALARRSLNFGAKAHLGRVMKAGNYRLDQWLLGAIAGPRELGLYSVAVAWAEALYYLPEALGMVMRPDVVRASPREAGRRAGAVFRAAVVLTAPAVLLLVVLAPFLCVTVFGSEFEGSIDDLRVLAPGAFGMVAMKLLANTLTAQGRPLFANAAIAVAFVATIALDLVLIPAYGGLGAALASTLAYTAGGLAVAAIFAAVLGIRAGDLVPRTGDFRGLWLRLRSEQPS